jgi:hypothetical protein
MDEYKPKLTEIVLEMSKGAAKSISDFSTSFIAANLMPYIIPHVVLDESECHEKLSRSDKVGVIFGLVGCAAQAVGYYQLAKHDNPEYLLIPVITNIGSLVYEKGKKARDKLIEEHKRKQ